jgi:hypothetical protein
VLLLSHNLRHSPNMAEFLGSAIRPLQGGCSCAGTQGIPVEKAARDQAQEQKKKLFLTVQSAQKWSRSCWKQESSLP